MKKLIVVLLVVFFCVIALTENSFSAVNAEYEDEKGPSATCPGTTAGDNWNFFSCYCTSYVAWRLNEHFKFIAPSSDIKFTNQYRTGESSTYSAWSDAKNWGHVAEEIGITVDDNPKRGSIGWRDSYAYGSPEAGHVFFVEDVNGSQILISEYNGGNGGGSLKYWTGWINSNQASDYIHFTPSHLDYLLSVLSQSETAYWEVIHYQQECQDTGLCETGGEGGSSSSDADFTVSDVWLEDEIGNVRVDFFPDERIKMKAQFKNTGNGDSPDDIEVRFYLSNGTKVDSNPDHVGTDNIQESNMESGETQTETEGVDAPTALGTYNITACADTQDDVDEEHESNNCSNEAVFEVVNNTPPPASSNADWLIPLLRFYLED